MPNNKMNYQLVLQFPLSDAAAEDFDRLLMIENELELALRDNHHVHGHDIGSGVMNIFIHSNNPHETFKLVKNTLPENDFKKILIAVTDIKDNNYTVMWPVNYKNEFAIK